MSLKNIFRSYLSDRLSSILLNLIFSVLKNERGVRGEFHFSKLLFNSNYNATALLLNYRN